MVYYNSDSARPKKIPKEEYPKPVATKKRGFDTFVAFDLETTGFSSSGDSMTEIGAVKVVNGKVVEDEKFIFQSFVHPYRCYITPRVAELTGITNEMVADAPEMWEIFPKFVDFIGDNILLGFNCMSFDSRYLVRAGRYSNLVIDNEYFDVMTYANAFKSRLGFTGRKFSLAKLSEILNIENPQAHRAVADALTTARVYIKLLEMEKSETEFSLYNG